MHTEPTRHADSPSLDAELPLTDSEMESDEEVPYESAGVSGAQELSFTDSLMHDDSIPDKHVHFSDDEVSGNDHLPKADSRKDWWKPLPEEERPATPKPDWIIPKGISPALLISRMKASRYPDFGLELLVPEQMWIDDVYTYDISAKYGISHCYQTQLNLTKPGWDETGYEFKHDYTIIESPRAVVFPVDNNNRKIMRFNEIYKFSDGTLTRILESLDYKVKEFKVKRLNPGMNTRFWTQKDVTRGKEFIAAIER
ncbi:hypothetical protein Tco_0114820 [Tanacetum coccineum]